MVAVNRGQKYEETRNEMEIKIPICPTCGKHETEDMRELMKSTLEEHMKTTTTLHTRLSVVDLNCERRIRRKDVIVRLMKQYYNWIRLT